MKNSQDNIGINTPENDTSVGAGHDSSSVPRTANRLATLAAAILGPALVAMGCGDSRKPQVNASPSVPSASQSELTLLPLNNVTALGARATVFFTIKGVREEIIATSSDVSGGIFESKRITQDGNHGVSH